MKRTPHAQTVRKSKDLTPVSVDTGQADVLMSCQDEQLFATHGTTFHFASRFFPPAIRPAVVTLYAFFRTLDDLVDERDPGWQADRVCQELDAWQAWFEHGCQAVAPREPLGRSLAPVLANARIPLSLFEEFLQGLRSDLEPRAFADIQSLLRYCYQAAGTVGLAIARVLGADSEQALRAASQLGIAMQLTNILRDVGGDLAKGRIYLPQDELARFGSSPAHLSHLYQARQGPDERFRALMRYQITRARLSYAAGLHGCWLLPRNCRVPILLAGRLYRRILWRIEQQDYDVLRRRAATSLLTRVQEASIVFGLVALWQRGEVEGSAAVEVADGR